MKDGFVFYASWWEAIKNLQREMQGDVLTAIIEYGLYGETTESPKPIASAMLAMVKPQIDANNQRYENGKKGGRPKANNNQTETKQKPNNNQNITKQKPNNNQTETKPKPKDKDKDISEDIYKESSTKVEPKKGKAAAEAATLSRKEIFYQSLVPFTDTYPKEMIRAFFDYWTEMNKSCTKMRYEQERTWETAKRLATWANRENIYSHGNNNRGIDKAAKAQQLFNEYAEHEQRFDAGGDKVEIPDL